MESVVGADNLLATVILLSGGALFAFSKAVAARVALRADTDSVSDLDIGDFGAYAYGCAYDFVADAAGVCGRALGVC